MKKTQQIRDALTAHGPLTLEGLLEHTGLVGKKSVHMLCLYLRKHGQLTIGQNTNGETLYKLGAAPKRLKGARKAGRKTARAPKRMTRGQGFAQKVATARRNEAIDLEVYRLAAAHRARLTIDNLTASTLYLLAALRREVDGIENNHTLLGAVEAGERAVALAKASA